MERWKKGTRWLPLPGRKPRRWLLGALLALAVAVPAAGCGGPSDGRFGSADGKKIAELISALADDKNNPKVFATHFAQGVAPKPADAKRFAPYSFFIVGKPAVSGTTATAKVDVWHELNSTKVGQVEWSFVKEGDTWKLKTAPLP